MIDEPSSYDFDIKLDKGGEEIFKLLLEKVHSQAQKLESLQCIICPLKGCLKSGQEEFEVRGALIADRVIHLEFPFRGRVSLIMAGIIDENGTIRTKFIAILRLVDLPVNAKRFAQPINPDTGDTGTGTGTQTLRTAADMCRT
jgi:hypothetical protein